LLRSFAKDQTEFLDNEFLAKVQKRGSEIIDTCGKSSSSSAANAACDHVHDWWHGTGGKNLVSMAVISDGNTYGVPEGLMFSFPLDVN